MNQAGRFLFFAGLGGGLGQLILLTAVPGQRTSLTYGAMILCLGLWALGAGLIVISNELEGRIRDEDIYTHLFPEDEWFPECPTHGHYVCRELRDGCPEARERVE